MAATECTEWICYPKMNDRLMSLRPVVITVVDSSSAPFERHREPVRVGVSLPRGGAFTKSRWRLSDRHSDVVPVQTTPLDLWPDGTVRWMLVEFQADAALNVPSVYTLTPTDGAESSHAGLAISRNDTIVVSTGAATFHVPARGPGFIDTVRVDGHSILQSTAIVAEDAKGARYEFTVAAATIVDSGPLRAAVQLEGAFADSGGQAWLEGALQLNFYAGHGVIGAEFSVANPRAARHAGGTWDLGDPGSALIRDLSIEVVPRAARHREIRASLEAGDPMAVTDQGVSVYQDSSGGENWRHLNHINREGRVPATFRGFRANLGSLTIEGLRATPIVATGNGFDQITLVVPRFWQICPKKVSIDQNKCRLSMFPREYGDLHELQGGERATLRFSLCFGGDRISAVPLAWVRAPLDVTANPVSYREAGVWGPLTVGSPSALDNYQALVDAAIGGDNTFASRRELIDEYGWRNFGDLYADHEAVKQPLVSHYNNQYDALAGFIIRYLQTADRRWWALADDLALHVADIDLYHSDRDRAAYSGGHFWHTQHYQPAGTATHRAYSRRSGSSGGGPSAEHNYTTGLMLHYFLTGAERSRAAVVQLANWVIDMDDGAKSFFRWIDRGDTGLASGTRSTDFHGPGRGAGNSINALLDAHRLTNDDRYIDKADEIIPRCVHPDDDVEAMGLLDVENRWSYTVFLQVLGKYLDYRVERGLADRAFAYARAALVRYAVWMAEHERPYLQTPEKLEFPTETWAAQDLRKAAVFEFAARYAIEPQQKSLFLDRARTFVDESIAYLVASPTAYLTRPIVLLLAYAMQRPRCDAQTALVAATSDSWSPKVPFVPQRRRVMRRLIWTGAGLSAAALILMALLAS